MFIIWFYLPIDVSIHVKIIMYEKRANFFFKFFIIDSYDFEDQNFIVCSTFRDIGDGLGAWCGAKENLWVLNELSMYSSIKQFWIDL